MGEETSMKEGTRGRAAGDRLPRMAELYGCHMGAEQTEDAPKNLQLIT